MLPNIRFIHADVSGENPVVRKQTGQVGQADMPVTVRLTEGDLRQAGGLRSVPVCQPSWGGRLTRAMISGKRELSTVPFTCGRNNPEGGKQ